MLDRGGDCPHNYGIAECDPDWAVPRACENQVSRQNRRSKTFLNIMIFTLLEPIAEPFRDDCRILHSALSEPVVAAPFPHVPGFVSRGALRYSWLPAVAPTCSIHPSNALSAISHCMRCRSFRSRIFLSRAGSRSKVIFAG